jgi:hypothetical protein
MLGNRRQGHEVGAGVHYLCEVLGQLGAAQGAIEPCVGVLTGRVDDSPRRPLNPQDPDLREPRLRHLLLQLSGAGLRSP